MSRLNTLIIGDGEYVLTKAYRAGAMAARKETPHWSNPHRDGNQMAHDWGYGHDNECAGLHQIDGIDVIEAPATGREYRNDEIDAPSP